jgi:inosine triphosphate pyrophosphatase/XTP/dITP diphosphohydrolase
MRADLLALWAACRANGACVTDHDRAGCKSVELGFCVDALAGFPGPYTKYVLTTLGVAGLLRLIDPLAARSYRFVAALVHVDGEGVAHTFLDDRAAGQLALEADGTPCAGAWSALWSVFIPEGATRPLVALSTTEREALWTVCRAHSVYAQFVRWLSAAQR